MSIVALVATLLSACGGGGEEADRPSGVHPDRVVIVSVPRLGWDDVVPADMPALASLADQGGSAALSLRAIGRDTEPAEGYATLGAGNRMQADVTDVGTFGAREKLPNGRTATREAARSGRHPTGRFVVPGLGDVEADNAHTFQGAEAGALGDVVRKARWKTAVFTDPSDWAEPRSPAGLAVADEQGAIDIARTFGTRAIEPGVFGTDPAHVAQVGRLLPRHHVLALVELGDVARVDASHGDRDERQAAARRVDRSIGTILSDLDLTTDLVIVMSPTHPEVRAQPVPMVVAGPGIDGGLLRSGTTRRRGAVVLPDVAPAILTWLGLDVPGSMNGTAITVSPDGRSGLERLDTLRADMEEVRFMDRSQGNLLSTLPILFGSWSVLLLATLVLHGDPRRWLVAFLRWLALVIASVPVVTYLLGVVTADTWGRPLFFVVLFVAAIGIGSLAAAAERPDRRWLPPAIIAAFTWLVLTVDLVTGGRLQYATALGNSPTVAGRFYGLENRGSGFYAATALLLAGVAIAALRGRPGWTLERCLAVAAGIFLVTIVVDGLPRMGADVGGVLAFVPGAAVSLWLLSGRRLRGRTVALALAGGAAVAVLFGLLDLTRAPEDRTHLGRFLAGDSSSRDTVIRKALESIHSVHTSSQVWILVASLGLAAAAIRFRRERVDAAFADGTMARRLAISGLVMGALGAALNDSGVVVPAMMALVLVPTAVYVLLAPATEPTAPVDDGEPAGAADPEPVPEPA